MKTIISKPCRICGESIYGIPRPHRKRYYYPKQCQQCKNKPQNIKAWHYNMSKARLGDKNPKFKPEGSTCLTQCGKFFYRKIKINNTWKYEHRVIIENHLDRKLLKTEIVHHLNGNTLDNRFENLIITTLSEHCSSHHKGIFESEKTKLNIKLTHWRHKN